MLTGGGGWPPARRDRLSFVVGVLRRAALPDGRSGHSVGPCCLSAPMPLKVGEMIKKRAS